MSEMRDADMPLLDRIDAAIKRVTNGDGTMRIPVEATDPDIVLRDCKQEIERLRAAVQHEADCVEAAKAEIDRLTRERDEARAERDALGVETERPE